MRLGIRGKIALVVASSIVLAMAAVAAVVTDRVRDHLTGETMAHARALAVTLAGNSIESAASEDLLNLNLYVQQTKAVEGVSYALVTDANGRLLAHSDPARTVARTMLTDAITVRTLAVRDVLIQVDVARRPPVYDVACAREKGRLRVIARVGVSQERILSVVGAVQRTVFGVAAVVLVLVFGASLWVTRAVTSPVADLAEGARRLGEGELTIRVPVRSGDEIGVLAATFNDMADHLARARAALERRVEAADRRLIERNRQMDASFASIRDGVLVTHGDGTPLVVNEPARAALALPGGGLPEIPLPLLVPPGPLGDAVASGSRAAEGGEPFRAEVSVPLAGGRRSWHRVSADPVRGESGETFGAVIVVRDVTLDRELDEMKSEFISHISHELRTPLTALQGALALLVSGAGGRLPAKARRFVTIGQANGDQLMGLIQDLLELARFEAGKSVFRFAPVAITPLAASAFERVLPIAEGKSLRMEKRLAKGLPALRGDAEKLRQLLNNLLSNAIKYTPAEGRVTLSVSAGGGRPPTSVRIAVRDTGVGIPREEQAKIFEKFHRVDNPLAGAGGVGLGLPIVRYIVTGHGGTIEVESEPGRGSVFSVVLPLAGPDAAPREVV